MQRDFLSETASKAMSVFFITALVGAIFLTVYVAKKQQDLRQEAAAPTTPLLSPTQVPLSSPTVAPQRVSILEYNSLLDCEDTTQIPLPMNDSNATFNSAVCRIHPDRNGLDLTIDGVLDKRDYQMLLREFSTQK